LRTEEDTAVISSDLASSRSDFDVGEGEPAIELSGFYEEDPTLPDDLYIEVKDPQSGPDEEPTRDRVLEETAFFAPGVMSSQATVDDLAGLPVSTQGYQFRLKEGVDPGLVAKDLEKAFAQNGLQAVAIKQEISDGSASQGLFNNLLMGFLGLGLLVGIAARSVVERRQQIGMLRALGF